MKQPGVWILGATDDHDRTEGMGIVFEYGGQTGSPRWTAPGVAKWNYAVFGTAGRDEQQAEKIPLVFQKVFAGHRWVDKWTINGKMWPKPDPIRLKANQRYRLVFDNRSDEAHPVHLHRHTFELTKIEGTPVAGIFKDVVVVQPMTSNRSRVHRRQPRAYALPLPSAIAYGLRLHDIAQLHLEADIKLFQLRLFWPKPCIGCSVSHGTQRSFKNEETARSCALRSRSLFAQVSVGIHIGPPPPRGLLRYHAPGTGYVWIAGYWYPVNGRYVWHNGYWSRPPYGARWVEPHHDGARFYGGFWDGPHGRLEHDHRWDHSRDRDYRH